MNQVNLIGRAGKNPELRTTAQGQQVATFTIATSEKYKDKSGVKQTKTTWHNIVIWGKLAEVANNYIKKGDNVFVSGSIDNRSYDDKDGNKKYISEIKVDKLEFLSNIKSDSQDSGSQLLSDNDMPF